MSLECSVNTERVKQYRCMRMWWNRRQGLTKVSEVSPMLSRVYLDLPLCRTGRTCCNSLIFPLFCCILMCNTIAATDFPPTSLSCYTLLLCGTCNSPVWALCLSCFSFLYSQSCKFHPSLPPELYKYVLQGHGPICSHADPSSILRTHVRKDWVCNPKAGRVETEGGFRLPGKLAWTNLWAPG